MMGTQEEIRRMRNEGKNEREIIDNLKKSGVSEKEIIDSLSQMKIKEAVTAPPEPQIGQSRVEQNTQDEGYSPQLPELPPLEETQQYEQQYAQQYSEYQQGNGTQSSYPVDAYVADAYSQYQPYQEALSTDLISEISEQVVNEKLVGVQDNLEKALSFRTVAETRLTSLNERLKRIEGILDTLQLSLLQRVGEYVSDVKDIKHELEETQKSFKALSRHGHHLTHSTHHEHKKKHHP